MSGRVTSLGPFSLLFAGLFLTAASALPTAAQFQLPEKFGSGFSGFGHADTGDPVTASAQFTAARDDRPAVLMITARIAPGWHMYSLTQPEGGPQKSRIELEPSESYRLRGPFRPNPPYQSHIDDVAWIGLELQEHSGDVTWYAPIELSRGVDPQSLTITGKLIGQACKESCIPIKLPFSASLGGGVPIGEIAYYGQNAQPADSEFASPAGAAVETGVRQGFQLPDSAVTVGGRIYPAAVAPGSTAVLEVTLAPPAGWHVYALAETVPAAGPRPTLIAPDRSAVFELTLPTTSQPVIEQDQSAIGWDVARIHEGTVTWTARVRVPPGVQPGSYVLSGVIGYQACEDGPAAEGSCEIPKAVRFQAPVEVSPRITSMATPLTFAAAEYTDAAKLAETASYRAPGTDSSVVPMPPTVADAREASDTYDLGSVVIDEATADGSILHYVLLAFVGGIILNLMPCVLPVIGLKVMSFVQQAGHSRAQAFTLNLWYSAGIISVFLVFAGLAISVGLSWGGQFGNTPFNVALTAVVFAMALSLLGVWEIPIPGFLGSGTTQDMAEKEGPLGAFLKGVITTVLATPCTGPFMATAIGWAVGRSPATTLTVFASLGLGMASPYLLIGAYPSLVRFLPKPGNWMVTFKQLMGFVLLGTVVFLLSFMESTAIVPTVALLVGIGLACWSVSRTPLTAHLKERLEAWGMAAAIVLIAAVVSFGWLYQKDKPWPAFSLAALQKAAVEEGKTVLVDFSAEWCFTCKTLESTVLHTKAVERAIENADIVTLYADFTDYPEEIDRTLRALGSNGVPVIAIFPGDAPYSPIVFRGGYTQNGLLAAIQQASTTGGGRSEERVARNQ